MEKGRLLQFTTFICKYFFFYKFICCSPSHVWVHTHTHKCNLSEGFKVCEFMFLLYIMLNMERKIVPSWTYFIGEVSGYALLKVWKLYLVEKIDKRFFFAVEWLGSKVRKGSSMYWKVDGKRLQTIQPKIFERLMLIVENKKWKNIRSKCLKVVMNSYVLWL